MKVEIENNSGNKKLKLCDIVRLTEMPFSKDEFYIVLKEGNGYIARSLHKSGGANGHHDTIGDLEQSLKVYGLIHYSSDEFKIVLKRLSLDGEE